MSFELLKLSDILSILSIVCSSFVGVAVIWATYKGPIKASEDADKRRADAEIISRKINVFRMLMGHRYDFFNATFVQGLNLVQIEFHDSPRVLGEFKKFIQEFRDRSHESDQVKVGKDRSDAVTRLIVEIGRDLNYTLDPLSLFDESYAPVLWRTNSDKHAAIMDMLHEIAIGQRCFPVLNIMPDKFISKDSVGNLYIRTEARID